MRSMQTMMRSSGQRAQPTQQPAALPAAQPAQQVQGQGIPAPLPAQGSNPADPSSTPAPTAGKGARKAKNLEAMSVRDKAQDLKDT